jgi:fructose-bisphosphate aldolase class 1
VGLLPGIKADTGISNLTDFPGKTITEGLDG